MWVRKLANFCGKFRDLFQCGKRNGTEKANQYLQGLFHESKSNIERMSERVSEAEAQQLNHFISDSPWDAKAVMQRVAEASSVLYSQEKQRVGLLIDECGWRKSGKHSVGVARQYLGSMGKTENGQVGVFAALAQHDQVSLINGKLFLPKVWTEDTKRCRKAGIPEEEIVYKTKPELALEMVEELNGQAVHYDWIGADALYGNSPDLRKGLDKMGKLYVMDIHSDQLLYAEHPAPYIPEQKPGKGRKKSAFVTDKTAVKASELIRQLKEEDWQTITYRQGTKGGLTRQVFCQRIFIWSKTRPNTQQVEEVRLVISRNTDGSEVKYSLVNDVKNPNSLEDLLYMQMQRYWVERAFQQAKSQLGMAEYQVRSWKAWHHHIALTMMAQLFMLEQKMEHREEQPLLSCSDIKLILALTLPKKDASLEDCHKIIRQRHLKRQNDINRYQNQK